MKPPDLGRHFFAGPIPANLNSMKARITYLEAGENLTS
jgi:hypothetical protein